MRRSEALHSSLCGVDVGAQLDSLLLQQPPSPPRTRAPSPITPVPPSAPSVSSPKGRWVNQKWWVSSVWEKTLNPKGSHLPTCACVSQHEFKLQPCLEHAVRELCQGVKRVRGKGRGELGSGYSLGLASVKGGVKTQPREGGIKAKNGVMLRLRSHPCDIGEIQRTNGPFLHEDKVEDKLLQPRKCLEAGKPFHLRGKT